MDYRFSKCAAVIPPYGGLKLYDSPEYEHDVFLPYYASEKDLSEINKFLDARKYKPGRNLIDVLFTDKANVARFSILHLISRMRERQVIKKRNLEKIDYDMDRFRTHLAQAEDFCLYNEIFDLDRRKARMNLEGKIAGLGKDRRAEEISCWHDLIQMRKELMDVIKEYRATARKKELIINPESYDRYG